MNRLLDEISVKFGVSVESVSRAAPTVLEGVDPSDYIECHKLNQETPPIRSDLAIFTFGIVHFKQNPSMIVLNDEMGEYSGHIHFTHDGLEGFTAMLRYGSSPHMLTSLAGRPCFLFGIKCSHSMEHGCNIFVNPSHIRMVDEPNVGSSERVKDTLQHTIPCISQNANHKYTITGFVTAVSPIIGNNKEKPYAFVEVLSSATKSKGISIKKSSRRSLYTILLLGESLKYAPVLYPKALYTFANLEKGHISKQKRLVYSSKSMVVYGPLRKREEEDCTISIVEGAFEPEIRNNFFRWNVNYCGTLTRCEQSLVWVLDDKYYLFMTHSRIPATSLSWMTVGARIVIFNAFVLRKPSSGEPLNLFEGPVLGFSIYARSSIFLLKSPENAVEYPLYSLKMPISPQYGQFSYSHSPFRHHYERLFINEAGQFLDLCTYLLQSNLVQENQNGMPIRFSREAVLGYEFDPQTRSRTRRIGILGLILSSVGKPMAVDRSIVSEFLMDSEYIPIFLNIPESISQTVMDEHISLKSNVSTSPKPLLPCIVGVSYVLDTIGSKMIPGNTLMSREDVGLGFHVILAMAVVDVVHNRLLLRDLRSESFVYIYLRYGKANAVFGSLVLVKNFAVLVKDSDISLFIEDFEGQDVVYSMLKNIHLARTGNEPKSMVVCPSFGKKSRLLDSSMDPTAGLVTLPLWMISNLEEKTVSMINLGFSIADTRQMQIHAALCDLGEKNFGNCRMGNDSDIAIFKLSMMNGKTIYKENVKIYIIEGDFAISKRSSGELVPQFRNMIRLDIAKCSREQSTDFFGVILEKGNTGDAMKLKCLGEFVQYSPCPGDIPNTEIETETFHGLNYVYIPKANMFNFAHKMHNCIEFAEIRMKNLKMVKSYYVLDEKAEMEHLGHRKGVKNVLAYCLELDLLHLVDFKRFSVGCHKPVICSLISFSFVYIEMERENATCRLCCYVGDGTEELSVRVEGESAWTILDPNRYFRQEMTRMLNQHGMKFSYNKSEPRDDDADDILLKCIKVGESSGYRYLILCSMAKPKKRGFSKYDNGIGIELYEMKSDLRAAAVYSISNGQYLEYLKAVPL